MLKLYSRVCNLLFAKFLSRSKRAA